MCVYYFCTMYFVRLGQVSFPMLCIVAFLVPCTPYMKYLSRRRDAWRRFYSFVSCGIPSRMSAIWRRDCRCPDARRRFASAVYCGFPWVMYATCEFLGRCRDDRHREAPRRFSKIVSFGVSDWFVFEFEIGVTTIGILIPVISLPSSDLMLICLKCSLPFLNINFFIFPVVKLSHVSAISHYYM